MSFVSRYADFLPRPQRDVEADLESFAQLLLKWNVSQNLVSRETVGEIWPRHIADSLQLLPLIRAEDRHIVDLGSGGGFPALPLAVALKGSERAFTLVEPIQKKASFLRTVIRELGLPARVVVDRAESLVADESARFDLATSRALASLDVLCGMIAPLLRPDGHALLHKGREHPQEIAESRLAWDFDVVNRASGTDDSGAILEISNLRLRTS
ncbi:16S rRNA (guanine(527)-N(7))-methyltransferase RsmG [Devosia sp.]|uniref:16S rRNA (guanine(527)-N(7))-methyltransferase RsmG n=1 Tax=Devosia sp. TaxID=1871048 RepID=UPI003A93A63B